MTWFWNIGAYPAVAQAGPRLGGNVGGDRRDDPWVRLLELAQDRSIECRVMLAAMIFAAAAFHGWLRVYSIASLVTSIVAGIVSFMAAPYEPTLVLGIAERISIGAFLLWVAVLAVALWRTPSVQPYATAPTRMTASGSQRCRGS